MKIVEKRLIICSQKTVKQHQNVTIIRIFELLEFVFGEYFSTASPALLTKGRNDANAPSPAVASLRGKRLVCCSEPDEKEPIKTGVMKEMTGGDRLVGRHLNMPPIEFTPQLNIFFLCNDKPDIESTDELRDNNKLNVSIKFRIGEDINLETLTFTVQG